ncbi:ATP-binding protein [Bartonella sp. DGB2]|uniref:ATP-binding protein n=1 Tax=Bartonella sp. DGB2 TaxID=3388426 RepID=UPI0039901C33
MASMQADIVNRIMRLPKPYSSQLALQPLFEAVSNSLHAIEDGFDQDSIERGKITVNIQGLKSQADIIIEVIDNGIGLDESHFLAFCTTDTGYKLERGGKGVGRLLWLDAFNNISVTSIYYDSDKGSMFRRSFTLNLKNDDQVKEEEIQKVLTPTSTGTTVVFKGLREKSYKEHFPRTAKPIIDYFASHFFASFITGKSPLIELNVEQDTAIFPKDVEAFKVEYEGITAIQDENNNNFKDLKLMSFICSKNTSKSFKGNHQIHFVANDRTVMTRQVDGLLGIGCFGPEKSYCYHGCITGDFLDKQVNQERTQFNFEESTVEDILKKCADHVREQVICDEIKQFDNERSIEMKKFVEQYPSFGFAEISELLKNVPRNAINDEEFAKALIPHRIRRDKERNKQIKTIINDVQSRGFPSESLIEDVNDKVQEAADAIRAEEQRQLTEYVLRRKTMLDLMGAFIQPAQNEGQAHVYEEALHKLICPVKLRGDDPKKVKSSKHDLWIIDERLTFTSYFASDESFKNITGEKGNLKRPDLFLYDHVYGLSEEDDNPLKRVMLVEFKRPGFASYKDDKMPMDQVTDYIAALQDKKIKKFDGSDIRLADDCVFYCYIIADILGKLEERARYMSTTANGRGRIQILTNEARGSIEIIQWADLLNDARLRNRAFIEAAGLRYESLKK